MPHVESDILNTDWYLVYYSTMFETAIDGYELALLTGVVAEETVYRVNEEYRPHTRRKRHRKDSRGRYTVKGRFVFLSSLDLDDPDFYGFTIETLVDESLDRSPIYLVGSRASLDRTLMTMHLCKTPQMAEACDNEKYVDP